MSPSKLYLLPLLTLALLASAAPSSASSLGARGPLPADVNVLTPASVPRIAVPNITACGNAARRFNPSIQNPTAFQFEQNRFGFAVAPRSRCSESTVFLRRRLLSLRRRCPQHVACKASATVLQARRVRVTTGPNDDFLLVAGRCFSFGVYAEYCGLLSGKLFCRTTRVVRVPRAAVQEPLLLYRPPIKIELGVGDSVRILTRLSRDASFSTLGNGGSNRLGPTAIQGVLQSADERIVSTTSLRVARSVTTRVPGGGRGGVTLRDNGAMVYLQFALPSCRSNVGSFRDEFATTILVSRTNRRLVKQDVRLPRIVRGPRRLSGAPAGFVDIGVEGVNEGSGRVQGGGAPELHYQWYRRGSQTRFGSSRTEAIEGETGKRLRVRDVDDGNGCGVDGCVEVGRFVVDVCNTFGCARSL